MLLSCDVPLAPLTTLRLGGQAARVATASDEADLVEALRDADSRGDEVLVLGGGSNVVVADEGFAGLVVRIASRGVATERRGSMVLLDVAAGEDWDALVGTCVDDGFSGVESLAGIPGLVGATPIQNVGAYGHEVSETLVRVRAYDRKERRFVEIDNAGCAFGYRTSLFRGKSRYVVAAVTFQLDATSQSAGPLPE
jgi:UDP-N-acetylmuramate dehydrogenase